MPFGLGPALHAVLRKDRAAVRALLDCRLVFDGMDELGLKLHPCSDARLFSACELGRESGDLRAQLARWALAQYRKLNLPAAD